jgi:hypothetical protein
MYSDRRTFKRLKEAPIKHSIVMFITIILILMSHNLANTAIGIKPTIGPKITTHERRNKPVTNVANRVVAPIDVITQSHSNKD